MDQLENQILLATSEQEFKLIVRTILRKFNDEPKAITYAFPKELTNKQRELVHTECRSFGLNSKSRGQEPYRELVISRKISKRQKLFHLVFNDRIDYQINNSLAEPNLRESPFTHKPKISSCLYDDKIFGRLCSGVTSTVPPRSINRFEDVRKSLPVWAYKNEFLKLLRSNQMLLIAAETGSGKTTQIPQYILEDACATGAPCKIICTQPRRISTLSVAERVAEERGEKVGETIGYQIKLESKMSLNSALIYCTNGILLRTMMNNPEKNLENITHIIIDEIHERDKYTDFLLISLKRCLEFYPKLKIILMSATVNINLFMSYFPNMKLLNIPGKSHFIREMFLEEILVLLRNGSESSTTSSEENQNVTIADNTQKSTDFATIELFNLNIEKCVETGDESCFAQLMTLVVTDNVDVNHQSPKNGFTLLMAAAMHGNINTTTSVLNIGADISLRSFGPNQCYNARDWANYYEKSEILQILDAYESSKLVCPKDSNINKYILEESAKCEAEVFQLILNIIVLIRNHDSRNTILVFLPGYEDIMSCQDVISNSNSIDSHSIEMFMLHSSMPIKFQNNVFKPSYSKQKIILSTNIAETSITIPDVVYVINSGLVKEKVYDSVTGTGSLRTTWISKANVTQRKGRVGRTQPGFCFHTFSRAHYETLLDNQIPEILRVPLHDLCIQTKLLAPKNCSIVDYLHLAINPPSISAVESAIQALKTLGALDETEKLTNLGKHLVQFSIDPRYGKMLLYAIVFKCLDPVLTIVASLAHQDPFVLPQNPNKKQLATKKQKELALDSLSDHITLLRAFQLWQNVESTTKASHFVRDYFINSTTMSTIQATRSHLLSQLRAAGFISMHKPFTVQDANKNSHHWHLIKAALASGYYPNVAFMEDNACFSTRMESVVKFLANSSLYKFSGCDAAVMYNEISKTNNRCILKCGTLITPLTIALICGEEIENSQNNLLTVDDWLYFRHNYENLKQFRSTLLDIINKQIHNPLYDLTKQESGIMFTFNEILSIEDENFKMPPVEGVGQPPKLYSGKPSNNRPRFYDSLRQQCAWVAPSINLQYFPRPPPVKTNTDVFDNVGLFEVPPPFLVENHLEQFRQLSQNGSPNMSDILLNSLHITANRGRNGVSNYIESSTEQFVESFGHLNGYSSSNGRPTPSNILPRNEYRFPPNPTFFIIKPPTDYIFSRGISSCTWLFSPQTERKIFKILNGHSVLLFYSISKTEDFQGMARLLDGSKGDVNVPCPIEWISTECVSYNRIRQRGLRNSFDNSKFVCDGCDGQEVDASTGRKLSELFFQEAPSNCFSINRRPLLGRSNV